MIAASYMGFTPDTETRKTVSQNIEELLDRAPLGSECMLLLRQIGHSKVFHGFAQMTTSWGTLVIRADGLKPQAVVKDITLKAKNYLLSLKPKLD
ncbi:MAG: hypothetical protein JST16_01275 [Bdellovibrionales bacterium]|nr:hypothetical protein [Bdellovibrionales bacterium]